MEQNLDAIDGPTETVETTRFEQSAPAYIRPEIGTRAGVAKAMDLVKAIKTFIHEEFVNEVDYGVVPGTKSKTLLLPGAQKLGLFFDSYPNYIVKTTEFGNGHVEHIVTSLWLDRQTDRTITTGVGSCTTMEKKYRYRSSDRVCPECGATAIFRSKYDDKGWYCYDKKGGCSAKFKADDPRITEQQLGQVENPDIHDQRNTVLKMAKKRAYVDAAMSIGAVSDVFTQDLDDVFDMGSKQQSVQQPGRQADTTAQNAAGDAQRGKGTEYGGKPEGAGNANGGGKNLQFELTPEMIEKPKMPLYKKIAAEVGEDKPEDIRKATARLSKAVLGKEVSSINEMEREEAGKILKALSEGRVSVAA